MDVKESLFFWKLWIMLALCNKGVSCERAKRLDLLHRATIMVEAETVECSRDQHTP
jgi:hypothetical protein